METKTQTIQVRATVLKAALTHAADKDIRYYLCGVLIDLSTGHVVATDGHRMLVHKLAESAWSAGESFIIPGKPLAAALRKYGTGRKLERAIVTIKWWQTLTPDAERAGVTCVSVPCINIDGEEIGAPIDGRFPDWQRVTPRSVSGERAWIDPRYAMEAQRALNLIAGRPLEGLNGTWFENGTAPSVLTLAGTDTIIVCMPYRETVGAACRADAAIAEVLGGTLVDFGTAKKGKKSA